MNYLSEVKQRSKLYGIILVSSSSTYGIICLLGCGKPIVLRWEQIIGIVLGAALYIFIGLLFNRWTNSSIGPV